MSLWNHYDAYTDLAYSLFNDPERPGAELPRCPERAVDLWPRWIGEGWFEWEPDGWPFWSHHHHLSTWWQWRELPNVYFIHFGDLLADTEGEMRRLAVYCGIEVPEERWPGIVDAVQLDAMRKDAKRDGGGASMIFEGGIDRFLFKGTNGRWKGSSFRRRSRSLRTSRDDARLRIARLARTGPGRLGLARRTSLGSTMTKRSPGASSSHCARSDACRQQPICSHALATFPDTGVCEASTHRVQRAQLAVGGVASVGVEPSNAASEAVLSLVAVFGEGRPPEDAWYNTTSTSTLTMWTERSPNWIDGTDSPRRAERDGSRNISERRGGRGFNHRRRQAQFGRRS